MKNTSEAGVEKDEDVLFSIVEEMAGSMTGEQSTRHWAKDALWFDIPAFASKGVKPAMAMFDKVFGSFLSCKVDILEKEITVNMGIVCTLQNCQLKSGQDHWSTYFRMLKG